MTRNRHDGSHLNSGKEPVWARPAIVCLAHLGWDYVWQRPQQILSRLAHSYPTLYINEPELEESLGTHAQLRQVAVEDNLKAWQPIFDDHQYVYDNWRRLYTQTVKHLLQHEGWLVNNNGMLQATRPLIFWFYTPIPYYVLDHLPADLVVYDIMDDLASFKGAAADLKERETRLLQWADLVFTGGRSLHSSREGQHDNMHLYASGVEVEHFRQALEPSTSPAAQLAEISQPILGYYGAIDERIDFALLEALARQHRDWSIAMVGPTVKIEQSALPREPNIHYLGLQPYEQLPSFLKAFTVCLMPFAINQATRSISPTKTLEYMAAHKPIVSTPVPDVVSNWGDVVYIADGPVQFSTAIKQALHETEKQRALRRQREAKHLALSSWDYIAAELEKHVRAALAATSIVDDTM